MNVVQQAIHLAVTDEDARHTLQAEGAVALAQPGVELNPEERAILEELADLLALPASTLADRFQGWYLSCRRRWS